MTDKRASAISTVLIYSPLWPVATALIGLCHNSKGHKCHVVMGEADILPEAIRIKPDILVVDISPRIICGMLNVFRHYFPTVPVIITQSRFLFSDRVVAEYFGHIWLKEYDALLAGYPETDLPEHILSDALAGVECGRLHCLGEYLRLSQLRDALTCQIRRRLFAVTRSQRLCEVVMDWLVKGNSPAEVSRSIARSTKLVYYYRSCVIRELNIRNQAMDFIPSLTMEITPGSNEGLSRSSSSFFSLS